MSIKIASWNVEGRLTRYATGNRGTPEHILKGIEALDADLLVLPEAYLEKPADGIDEKLRKLGYDWHDVPYGYDDRDWSQEFMGKMPSLRVLSRLAITNVENVQWAGARKMLTMTVVEPAGNQEVRIIPVHFDDRSEKLRMAQLHDIIPCVNESDMPTIMLGDFNAMWGSGRARFIGSRFLRFVARHLRDEELRDVAVRFTDMATGSILKELSERTNLRDADPRHQPTTTPKMRGGLEFMPSIPLAQIDHIFVSPNITVNHFTVTRDGGSDHRAIVAALSVNN